MKDIIIRGYKKSKRLKNIRHKVQQYSGTLLSKSTIDKLNGGWLDNYGVYSPNLDKWVEKQVDRLWYDVYGEILAALSKLPDYFNYFIGYSYRRNDKPNYLFSNLTVDSRGILVAQPRYTFKPKLAITVTLDNFTYVKWNKKWVKHRGGWINQDTLGWYLETVSCTKDITCKLSIDTSGKPQFYNSTNCGHNVELIGRPILNNITTVKPTYNYYLESNVDKIQLLESKL